MARSRPPAQIAKCRRLISDYYLRGFTYFDIQKTLRKEHKTRISIPTISRDIKAILADWKLTTTLDIDEAKVKELRKLDKVESELWRGWERSYGTFQKKIGKVQNSAKDGKKQEKAVQEWELAGDPKFLLGVVNCIKQRCIILGIEQVASINIFQNFDVKLVDENGKEVKEADYKVIEQDD